MKRHAGALAYGLAVAMARGSSVAVSLDVGDDFEGKVIARGHDQNEAATLNGGRAEPREGQQFSTVWADVMVRGERRRVWVNDVDALLVRGGKGTE